MTDRGVSEVVSFALVFSLIVSTVLVISVAGLGTLRDVRDAEQGNNAVRAMDVLADNVADIYRRGAPSRATEIDLKKSSLSIGDPVTINVSGEDTDLASNPDFVLKRDTVPIVYHVTDETTVVYEAGAVFRMRNDGGVMVRDPEYVLGTGRTAIQVLVFDGPTGRTVAGSTVLIRASHDETSLVVANTTGAWNVVRYNVTSPRYEQWYDYLVDKPGVTSCRTIDAAEKVACKLDAPPERLYVTRVHIDLQFEA